MNCPYCGKRVLVREQDNMEGNARNPVTGELGQWRAHNKCFPTTKVTIMTPGDRIMSGIPKSEMFR